LIAKSSYAQLVVSSGRGNLFYLGIENRIDYAVKDIKMNLVELRASAGEISKDNDGNLFWRSCEANPGKVVLSAYYRKTNKLIGEAEFRVKHLADPIIWFEPDSTENYAALGTYPPERQDWDYPCRLRKYDLTFKTSNTLQTITQEGYGFNDEARGLLHSMIEGDTVAIINIILRCGCIPTDREMSDTLKFAYKKCAALRGGCLFPVVRK
jgi:hypothetical protein